jgi:hypothetical protein
MGLSEHLRSNLNKGEAFARRPVFTFSTNLAADEAI